MTDEGDAERLKALEARIATLRRQQEPTAPTARGAHDQAHLAWRMVIELVAGLLIGFGIGYGLDRLFGTIPIFLVLFTLLGLAAGVKTMMRSAQEIQREKLAEQADRTAPDTAGGEKRTKDGDGSA